jgi:YHS domain-containing protein
MSMKMNKFLVLILLLAGFSWVAALDAAAPQSQTICPVMGAKINKEVYVDYKGQRIYFCCSGCDAEFRKDPEKYLKKMKEQGVTPEKAPQKK